VIDGAPQVHPFAGNPDHHLVEVPSIARAWAATPQLACDPGPPRLRGGQSYRRAKEFLAPSRRPKKHTSLLQLTNAGQSDTSQRVGAVNCRFCPHAALAARGLPLLKTTKGTTLASQRSGIRGTSA
jgi:hypothetical protein